MNIFEARKRLNEIDQLLLSEGASLKAKADANHLLMSRCADWIFKTIRRTILFQLLQSGDITEEQLYAMFPDWTEDIAKMKRTERYNPLNTFAALKIFGRRILEAGRRNNAFYRQLYELKHQYVRLGEEVRQARYFKGKEQILDEIDQRKALMMDLCERNDLGISYFYPNVIHWFSLGFTMTKQEFISLISADHRIESESFSERIKELPERLGFEEFLDAVFVQKVEDDSDSVFFDMVVDYTAEQIDRNKEFREKAHQFIQETFGPISTYTAAVDEFGDIVELVPNKPNLKVIH